jgi:type VI secretion system protein ImpF
MKHGQRMMPSLLDRLIDPGSAGWSGYGPAQTEAAVGRDIEELLNTRRPRDNSFGGRLELQRSILSYGLPDLSLYHVDSPQMSNQAARLIEDVLRQFEPRLRDVRATPLPPQRATVRVLIEAFLTAMPSRPWAFEAEWEPQRGRIRIRPTGGRTLP